MTPSVSHIAAGAGCSIASPGSRTSWSASWASAPKTAMSSASICASGPIPARRRLPCRARRRSTYYESAGQNWERAALIKARPVAGDRAAAAAFLADLGPFLWRRHLDFAAIQDIHSIKRQIDAHRGGGGIAVAGHNVKLGRGGIREIEFFAQTQQLIWGGRVPELRARRDLRRARARSAARGRITDEADGRSDRILSLSAPRRASPADGQRRADPHAARRRGGLAPRRDLPRLSATARRSRRELRVRLAHRRAALRAPVRGGADARRAAAISSSPASRTIPIRSQTLARLGFADPHAVSAMVRGWHHGRYRAMRSQRARELLTELVPTLLKRVRRLGQSRCGVHPLRPLPRAPAGRRAAVLAVHQQPAAGGAARRDHGRQAPRLADEIARRPGLLDGVLSAGFFDPLPPLRGACGRSRRDARPRASLRGAARPRAALGRRAQVPDRRAAAAAAARRRGGGRRALPTSPRPRCRASAAARRRRNSRAAHGAVRGRRPWWCSASASSAAAR